jgi:hypothetical protein
MSYSISTLLTRNLDDVFGENDPARRRAAIDEIFTEDCVFHEPRGVYHGRDEIDRVAGAIKPTHPDFRYQPIAPPEHRTVFSPEAADRRRRFAAPRQVCESEPRQLTSRLRNGPKWDRNATACAMHSDSSTN